jgi:hypothetical protein
MKKISLVRFNALAGYARQPGTFYMAEEIGWYEYGGERVLGLLVRDKEDNDFSGLVFARDRKLRFRAVDMTGFYTRRRDAEVELRHEMERMAAEPDVEYNQGDEAGVPVDFFTPVVPSNRLNPDFVRVRDTEGYSAARGIIEPMMRWYEDADGNFLEQFQTTGFDARIWELYLFATFSEMGYYIDRSNAIPDFICISPMATFCVEATTVNATRDRSGGIVPEPEVSIPEEMDAYLNGYMAIKFGSALKSKLDKKYWERPHVAGKPLIFAVQDFSSELSMTRTRTAFERYISGYALDWERDADGTLRIHPQRIGLHRWGAKEIPSGFFDLPDTENVSAVMFSNSGTISKFNRIGLLAGFGSKRLRLVRTGYAVNLDPNATAPIEFQHIVNNPDYHETWCEGLDVWHNPKAKYPLDPDLLPCAAHYSLLPDGQIVSIVPNWHPLSSTTLQFLGGTPPQ